ncbi:MAG: baseplate J/gp47 family protein [Pseudomonadota bacterium]
MSFARPALKTLIDRAIADINARLPGADARLPMSNLNVLAHMHGAAIHGLYGFLEWLARQVMIDTAEVEFLERWAGIWGVTRTPAAPASGSVTFTGTSGTVVPAGTLLARSDGVQYQTTAEVTLAAGQATAGVVAVKGGAAGNLASGTLSLVSPPAGVETSAQITAAGLTGGADTETDTALRARLLARIQQPPHGGAKADYIAWAQEVAGVTAAWCYPGELGPGTVTVRFIRGNDASIIPDAAEVAAVQAYLDERRPVTAAVTVVAPVAVPLNFSIQLTPNTSAVQAAVEAELRDLLLREAEPGATILLSHIREAISLAAGETNHVLVAPAADVTHTTGQMAVFGSITWL